MTPNLVSTVLINILFLIKKDKNRGKLLFTFLHPFQNGTSVWGQASLNTGLSATIAAPFPFTAVYRCRTDCGLAPAGKLY
jgi:hypothetical protein